MSSQNFQDRDVVTQECGMKASQHGEHYLLICCFGGTAQVTGFRRSLIFLSDARRPIA